MVYELPKFNIKSKRNIGLSSFTKSLHFIFFYVQIYTYIHKTVPKAEQNRGEMKMSRKGPLPASPCHEETGSCAPSGRCPRETQPAVAISSIGPSPGSSHEMRGFWAHEDRLAPWLQAAGLVGALGCMSASNSDLASMKDYSATLSSDLSKEPMQKKLQGHVLRMLSTDNNQPQPTTTNHTQPQPQPTTPRIL